VNKSPSVPVFMQRIEQIASEEGSDINFDFLSDSEGSVLQVMGWQVPTTMVTANTQNDKFALASQFGIDLLLSHSYRYSI